MTVHTPIPSTVLTRERVVVAFPALDKDRRHFSMDYKRLALRYRGETYSIMP